MKGPRSKPTSIKQIEGNPGCRPLNKTEAQPPALSDKFPPPPEGLGEYGAAEWSRAGPLLARLKLLTEADIMAFTSYCMNVEVMIQAHLDIQENGLMIWGARGKIRNPALSTFASATANMRAWSGEFGMTPSARSRIHLPGDEEDELQDILNGDFEEDAA